MVVIPTRVLDKGSWTVPASKVGKIGDEVIVNFPSSSVGIATWKLRESHLEALLAENDA